MTKGKEYKHYLFLLFVACALFFNFFLPNDLVSLVVTAVCCFYILFCKYEYYVPTAIFLTAYTYLFRYNKYGIFVFLCIFILLRGFMSNLKHATVFIVVVVVYAFSHVFSTFLYAVPTSIGDYIPLFSILCLLAVCMNYEPQSKGACIKHFLFGFFTSSVLSIWMGETRLNDILTPAYLSTESWQDTERFAGLSYDCNFYATTVILVLYILLFEDAFLFENKKKMKSYILFIVAAIFGMLTYSKMFLLVTVILLVLAGVMSPQKTRKKYLLLLPILGLLGLVFSDSIGEWLKHISARLENADTVDDLTTGRWEAWKQYIDGIFNNLSSLTIGRGIIQVHHKAAHNTYLEIVSKYGLFGVAGEIMLIYFSNKALLIDGYRKNWRNFWVCLIINVLLLFALSADTFPGLWVILFFILISKQDITNGEIVNGQHHRSNLQCRRLYRDMY